MKWLRRNFLFSLFPLAVLPTKPAMSRKDKIRKLVHATVDVILAKADSESMVVLLSAVAWEKDSYDYERLEKLVWEEYGCSECGSKKGKNFGRLSWRWCESCYLAEGGAA